MTRQLSGGVVCCRIADARFALSAADVRVVARVEQMIAEPPLWDGRIGVLHHAGTVTPVYSLAAALGLSQQSMRPDHHVVVTQGPRGPFALVVDRAIRMGAAETFDVLPLPAFAGTAAARWFAGVLRGESVSCLLLSPEGIEPGAGASAHRDASAPGAGTPGARGSSDVVAVFNSVALPRCEADRYAIAARRIAAVVQALPSVSLPGAAPFVTGVSWWQNAAVPLLDFTGLRARAAQSRYLLVRTRDGSFAGLPIGADVALRHATRDHHQVSGGTSDFVQGLFAIGEERVALIDVDALVTAGERALVASCAG